VGKSEWTFYEHQIGKGGGIDIRKILQEKLNGGGGRKTYQTHKSGGSNDSEPGKGTYICDQGVLF